MGSSWGKQLQIPLRRAFSWPGHGLVGIDGPASAGIRFALVLQREFCVALHRLDHLRAARHLHILGMVCRASGAAAPGQTTLVDQTPQWRAHVRAHLVVGTAIWACRWGTTSGRCGYCIDGGLGLDVGPDVREERFDVVGGCFTAVADQHQPLPLWVGGHGLGSAKVLDRLGHGWQSEEVDTLCLSSTPIDLAP
jgi:hypothetical protein